MAGKQARRRKPRKATKPVVLQVPRRVVRAVTVVAALVVGVGAATAMARAAFDAPIAALTIDAPFQRVNKMQLTDAAQRAIDGGFLTVRLAAIREALEALPWVDTASVRRVWPDRLHIVVAEQVPAARWGDRGLLNTRGELFLEDRILSTTLAPFAPPQEITAWNRSVASATSSANVPPVLWPCR